MLGPFAFPQGRALGTASGHPAHSPAQTTTRNQRLKEDLISKAQAHRGDLGLGDLDEGDREVRVLRRGFQRPPGLNAGAAGPEGQVDVGLEGL